MPKFTALVHVEQLSNAVEETLRAASVANDLLVVTDAEDGLRRKVRKLGGRVKMAIPGVSPGAYAMDSYHEWLLVLRPGEVLDDATVAALEAWKKEKMDEAAGHKVRVLQNGTPMESLRLINRHKINWTGELPPPTLDAAPLPAAPRKAA